MLSISRAPCRQSANSKTRETDRSKPLAAALRAEPPYPDGGYPARLSGRSARGQQSSSRSLTFRVCVRLLFRRLVTVSSLPRSASGLAMIGMTAFRANSHEFACLAARHDAAAARPHDGKGKARLRLGAGGWSGLSYFAIWWHGLPAPFKRNTKYFSTLSAIAILAHRGTSVSRRDDELRIRLGRIRDRGRNSHRPDTFIGEVMQAARKAGHVGESFGRGRAGTSLALGAGAARRFLCLSVPARAAW